jgi:hypothetical protein
MSDRGASVGRAALNRRQALLGLGAASLLPCLLPDAARAQSGPRKRLVVWFTPNGTVESEFRPKGGETDFTLGKILEPLTPHRDQLLLFGPTVPDAADRSNARTLRGLNMAYDGSNPAASGEHASFSILTGTYPVLKGQDRVASSISLDQYLADKLGAQDLVKSLQLGVDAAFPEVSFNAAGEHLPVENNPALAFQTLFGNLMTEDPAAVRRKLRRKSVLSTVAAQAESISRHLSGDDQRRVEAQRAALEDLATRLDRTFVCTPPTLSPQTPGDWNESNWDNFDKMPAIADAQLRLLATALGCGMTHVASMQYGWCAANSRHTFLNAPEIFHGLSHDVLSGTGDVVPNVEAKLVAINQWYMKQLAAFVQLLRDMPDADGTTVMDNTLILVVNELSHGSLHSWQNMPFFLVGSAGGYFKTGRYLTFDNKYHNDLLVSVLNAMGVEQTSFGRAELCKGPLAGLTA